VIKAFQSLWVLGLVVFSGAAAAELEVRHVAGPGYAIVGELGGRTYENHGLNATFGFVVTDTGVVLIDSGASKAGAALIEKAVASVTDKPVTHVINTGSQDHRWLGNGYFADKGAQVIALARTVDTQQRFASQHMEQLQTVLKTRLDGTRPFHAPAPVDGNAAVLSIGGVDLHLRWLGDAHFPGDAVVWLPAEGVLYSGDLVYVERLLGVLPWSDAAAWREAFGRMEALAPRHIVPGHGRPVGLEVARRDTGDYLDWLVVELTEASGNWEPIDDVIARLAHAPAFESLLNFAELHRGNLSRAYVQLEAQR
jgi:glyoxylase-like metal-dependent hydrolase (beta-lactamase superfamily II)